MPSLSFTRDHRGYEYTAVVHAGRRRNPDEQRILYWFRTPPGVKFGRVPIDEQVIRSLEEHNPELCFDWDKILKAPPAPPRDATDPRARARKGRREFPAPAREPAMQAPASPLLPMVAADAGSATVDAQVPVTPGKRQKRRRRGARGEATAAVQALPSSAEPQSLIDDQATAEDKKRGLDDEVRRDAADLVGEEPRAAVTAAGAVLGPEGLARLRTRCAELMARITERITDVERADVLRDQAARLDPDAWVTSEDVRAGLEHYEAVSQELRQALGPDPSARRGRRRGRASQHTKAGGPAVASGARGGDGPAEPEPGDSSS